MHHVQKPEAHRPQPRGGHAAHCTSKRRGEVVPHSSVTKILFNSRLSSSRILPALQIIVETPFQRRDVFDHTAGPVQSHNSVSMLSLTFTSTLQSPKISKAWGFSKMATHQFNGSTLRPGIFAPWYQLFAMGNNVASHASRILLHQSSSVSCVASSLVMPLSLII